KLSVREKTNSNAVNSNSKISNSANEVLGYKVDKDGYFTEEFNEAAGIPKDYKIHSSTMEKMVQLMQGRQFFTVPYYKSIDIAKSVGNAYKILSQVVGDELVSKNSFTLEELENLPYIYQYNKKTLEVTKTLSSEEIKDKSNVKALLAEDELNNFSHSVYLFMDNFFDDEIGAIRGKDEIKKYTNEDGSINIGGVLLAILNVNTTIVDGETTIMGKMSGYDRLVDYKALHNWFVQDQFQNVVVGDDFFEALSGTDFDEFMNNYAKYKEKKMKEREENSFTLEELIREIKKQIELMFGKSDELRKELEEEQKKLFTNEIRLDIKA
ncbi:Cj0814 family flagellar-dependent secreted protein, partial [Campylobacter troglodytis]|uniref:Cj0814 family flagellar-dependent secreted protein n=1 Tax=Campylobacter troglodytis TaxID=654363 RepID=UPI00163C2D8C